jgi:hypothetical protein
MFRAAIECQWMAHSPSSQLGSQQLGSQQNIIGQPACTQLAVSQDLPTGVASEGGDVKKLRLLIIYNVSFQGVVLCCAAP